MLAELPAGLVVAVHDHYLRMPGYRQAEGFLETTIRVPRLPDAQALARLLDHRIKAAADGGSVAEVFEPGALDELMAYYGGAAEASVRKTVQAAQRSVQIAAEHETPAVTDAMVQAAITEWL
jgi:Na+-translocating ferredoxin:NAD+ oxidoreductase RnfG subunit